MATGSGPMKAGTGWKADPEMGDPRYHADPHRCVDAILETVGREVILGLPLALGKANHIVNALYRRAEADRGIRLSILTALTLEKPRSGSELGRRLLDPIIERLFGDFPDPAYARPMREGTLPDNISVSEFYIMPGRWLDAPYVQQHYASLNYTHAARAILNSGINVLGQLVAGEGDGGDGRFSLSCNSDITLELLPHIRNRRGSKNPLVFAGQVNDALPFMGGEAALAASEFDHILDGPDVQFPLFAPPRQAVPLEDHAAALHVAGLVRDGGTIQIGIGTMADAVAWALVLRHTQNDRFCELIDRTIPDPAVRATLDCNPFREGLYAATEMFSPAFLDLYRRGVLRREAEDGAILHGAFFLGPLDFYQGLREMAPDERDRFRMRAVSFTNDLYGEDEAQRRRDRRDARFINDAMMVTLLGETVSDTLEDGRVVSGVGGQYNFVAQAHALDGARSIISVSAARMHKGRLTSNIRFSCGTATSPRHMRDMVVTQYGVADLRDQSDMDVAAAMLSIADSRFQESLLQQAKSAGKVPSDFTIPERFRNNLPGRVREALGEARREGLLPPYPFGSELDETEQRLAEALKWLKERTATRMGRARALAAAFTNGIDLKKEETALGRMGLTRPGTMKEKIWRRLLVYGLYRSETEGR